MFKSFNLVIVSITMTSNVGCTENLSTRFILLRGSSGFYSYAIYEHLKEWPAFNLGETRIAFKLRKDK